MSIPRRARAQIGERGAKVGSLYSVKQSKTPTFASEKQVTMFTKVVWCDQCCKQAEQMRVPPPTGGFACLTCYKINDGFTPEERKHRATPVERFPKGSFKKDLHRKSQWTTCVGSKSAAIRKHRRSKYTNTR